MKPMVLITKPGKAWKKVKSWFGYGLHLIADTRYEIPVAMQLTPASHSESIELQRMLAALFEETPSLAQRCQDFSADRGLDSGSIKASLWDDQRIRPLIDTRELWREEKQMPTTILRKRSPGCSIRRRRATSFIRKRARCLVFVRRHKPCVTWPSKGLKRTATV